MKKSLIYGVIWSSWLGYWLGDLGVHCYQLKFWIIFMPIVILANQETKRTVEERGGKNED